MEFKSDILKTIIVLKEDKVCIEIKGIFDKLGGLKSVEFKYEKINSIEIFEPKGFSLTVPNLTFKVDGQEFKGDDNLNPYKVQYSAKKKEEARKIREEIYRRVELKKNETNKSNISGTDESKKIVASKDQEKITEKEPKKVEEQSKSGGKGCLLFFGLPILILLILIPFFSNEEKTFDQGRADVFCGIKIKDTLNDPSSYKFDRSRVVKNTKDPELGKLSIVYRAKNGFGAEVRQVTNCEAYRANNEIKYKLVD